jgi:hypothetical protein
VQEVEVEVGALHLQMTGGWLGLLDSERRVACDV